MYFVFESEKKREERKRNKRNKRDNKKEREKERRRVADVSVTTIKKESGEGRHRATPYRALTEA